MLIRGSIIFNRVKCCRKMKVGINMKKKLMLFYVMLASLLPIITVNAEQYNNFDPTAIKSCGDGLMTNIPGILPQVISTIYTVVQIAVPVVLVIMGSLDFMKSVSAQKEDEIKKSQMIFVKRLISAVLVFFVFVIVKFVIGAVADGTSSNIMDCANCFIRNKC